MTGSITIIDSATRPMPASIVRPMLTTVSISRWIPRRNTMRRNTEITTHLAGFQGVLQVDGYQGYKTLARQGAVQLAFCWSHVRRPFYELAQSGPAPIAAEALVRIAALYRIEAEIRGRFGGRAPRCSARRAAGRSWRPSSPGCARSSPW